MLLCAGEPVFSPLMTAAGFRVGPPLPGTGNASFDITDPTMLEWILWLIQRRRLWGTLDAFGESSFSPSPSPRSLGLFIRYPFTTSSGL